MTNASQVYQLNTAPGIQRDGTQFESASYVDGQWVRFQRGKPKKMGGYRQITDLLNGPVRGINTWSRQSLVQVTLFSSYGVEAVQIDKNAAGQALYDRTPAGFAVDGNAVWQVDTMYDAAAGSTKTLLFAHPGANLTDIDSGTERDVFYGDASGTLPLTPIGGLTTVSGGVVAISPFLVIYGSDGRVSWSNENEPRQFATGSAGTARITGGKIVKALPIRGQGTSPSALLWSLDSVFRMSYVGGQSVFRFDPVSQGSSILSSSSVIEYDGLFFWVGIDRFMMYNGRVQELPNRHNLNWFFDNLNYEQRQKVHVTKVPRYGEIWWFFPFGEAEECTHAVIYNVRENYWYDVALPRTTASFSQVFRYPLMTDSNYKHWTKRLRVSSGAGYVVGSLVTGGTTGTQGTIEKILGNDIYVTYLSGPGWELTEAANGQLGGTGTIVSMLDVPLHQLWVHESGLNKVEGDNETGIVSYFESSNFGFPVGSVEQSGLMGADVWTRLTRVEPDFKLKGGMSMQVVGGETAFGKEVTSKAYPFTNTTERIDLREQRREIRLRFTSDAQGGDYEMGKVLIHMEPGDARS